MSQNWDMDVDADKLTHLLADRLTAIVPAGFLVRAADGMLWYSAETGKFPGQAGNYDVGMSGTYVRDNLEAHSEAAAERLAAVAAQALDELQDFIDEASHAPWPGDRTPPKAHAQVRGQMLHLWYGGPEPHRDVILACEPIALASLR
jgi:hypothetical protein